MAQDKTGFIVKNDDWFLATWTGDPGRTYDEKSARVYKTEHAARCAISYCKRHYPYRNFDDAKIITV